MTCDADLQVLITGRNFHVQPEISYKTGLPRFCEQTSSFECSRKDWTLQRQE